jgi:hypothetical protein
MCVIAFQTKEQPFLTYDEVKEMALTNPHGMGLMWQDGKTIQYKKGFFNVNEFYDFYSDVKSNPKTGDIALHFRIGTGSNIDGANCHPFPITSVPKRIKSLKGTCDVGVMMNGIIGSSTKEFSDTALYVMKNLKEYYDIDRRFFMHFSKRGEMLFENEIHGCRFVLMSKEGSKLFGTGWSDYEGKAMVSNRYWIPKKLPTYDNDWYYTRYCGYYDYDSYDDWYIQRASKRFSKKKSDSRHKSYIDYLQEGVV